MFSTQSLFHWSKLVDFMRVTVGPNARWAPEQFEHTNTPKSNEAPESADMYKSECDCHNQRNAY